MFIIIIIIMPTNARVNSIKLILKLLRHVSVLIHHPQGDHKLCQLKLRIIKILIISWIIKILHYCKLPEDGVRTPKHVRAILIFTLYNLHVH